jgi:hypothetical protein
VASWGILGILRLGSINTKYEEKIRRLLTRQKRDMEVRKLKYAEIRINKITQNIINQGDEKRSGGIY